MVIQLQLRDERVSRQDEALGQNIERSAIVITENCWYFYSISESGNAWWCFLEFEKCKRMEEVYTLNVELKCPIKGKEPWTQIQDEVRSLSKISWGYGGRFSSVGTKKPIDYHLEIALGNWEKALLRSWNFSHMCLLCGLWKHHFYVFPGILFFFLTGKTPIHLWGVRSWITFAPRSLF